MTEIDLNVESLHVYTWLFLVVILWGAYNLVCFTAWVMCPWLDLWHYFLAITSISGFGTIYDIGITLAILFLVQWWNYSP